TLPCESVSTSKTRNPREARPAAMLTEVVVFPVPPLWLKIARRDGAWMVRLGRSGSPGGATSAGPCVARTGRAPGSAPTSVIGGGRPAATAPNWGAPASRGTCGQPSSEQAGRSSPRTRTTCDPGSSRNCLGGGEQVAPPLVSPRIALPGQPWEQ